jgi:hypothetical protein
MSRLASHTLGLISIHSIPIALASHRPDALQSQFGNCALFTRSELTHSWISTAFSLPAHLFSNVSCLVRLFLPNCSHVHNGKPLKHSSLLFLQLSLSNILLILLFLLLVICLPPWSINPVRLGSFICCVQHWTRPHTARIQPAIHVWWMNVWMNGLST